MKVRVAVGVLAVVLFAAGCGEKDEQGSGSGSAREATTPAVPTGADDVVLQIYSGGGFVPQIDALGDYPEVVLYGDGRLITAPEPGGPDPAAVPDLNLRRLDAEQVGEVAAMAADAGLEDPLEDYGMPQITDLATTTFTFETTEGPHEASAYALGSEDEAEGVTDEQGAAREKLSDLEAELLNLDATFSGTAPEVEAFSPEAYVVSSIRAEGRSTGGSTENWPLGANQLASSDHPEVCTVVDRRDAEPLLKAVDKAGADSTWVAGKNRAEVAIRPAIGLEDDCPSESSAYVVPGD